MKLLFGLLVRVLSIFLLFLAFFSLSSFAISNCLTSIDSGDNVILNSYYTCESGFYFEDIENVTIDCNDNYLESLFGTNFSVINSKITFIDCQIRGSGNYVDTLNSQVFLRNSSSDLIDFENVDGTYVVSKRIFLDVLTNYGKVVSDINVTFDSLSVNNKVNSLNSNYSYVEIFKYDLGQKYDYNDYNISVKSNFYGSSNSTVLNLSSQGIVSLILQDVESPKLVSLDAIHITNSSINLEIKFDEKVTGTFYLYDKNDNLIETQNKILQNNIFYFYKAGLDELETYYFHFDVYDLNLNRFDSSLYPFTTYTNNVNISTGNGDFYEFYGNVEDAEAFNFSNNIYDIEIEYLENVEIQRNTNLSNYIVFEESGFELRNSRFNKKAKVIFDSLTFQTKPVIYVGDEICSKSNCNILNYSLGKLEVEIDDLSDKVVLKSNSKFTLANMTDLFVGKRLYLEGFYEKVNDSYPLFSNYSFCRLKKGANTYDGFYDNVSKSYKSSMTFTSEGEYDLQFICSDISYDDLIYNFTIEVVKVPMPSYDLALKINPVDVGSKTTQEYQFEVDIKNDNQGYDNLVEKYYVLFSKDKGSPLEGWNKTYNLTPFVRIDKSSSIIVSSSSNNRDFTQIILDNGNIVSVDSRVFVDDLPNEKDRGTPIFVNFKACFSDGFCKVFSNPDYYFIFDEEVKGGTVVTEPPVDTNTSMNQSEQNQTSNDNQTQVEIPKSYDNFDLEFNENLGVKNIKLDGDFDSEISEFDVSISKVDSSTVDVLSGYDFVQVFDISGLSLYNTDISKAEVTFKLDEKVEGDFEVYRYVGLEWEKLYVVDSYQDSGAFYIKVETPGFSKFAVVQESSSFGFLIAIILVIVLVVIVGVLVFMFKDKFKPNFESLPTQKDEKTDGDKNKPNSLNSGTSVISNPQENNGLYNSNLNLNRGLGSGNVQMQNVENNFNPQSFNPQENESVQPLVQENNLQNEVQSEEFNIKEYVLENKDGLPLSTIFDVLKQKGNSKEEIFEVFDENLNNFSVVELAEIKSFYLENSQLSRQDLIMKLVERGFAIEIIFLGIDLIEKDEL